MLKGVGVDAEHEFDAPVDFRAVLDEEAEARKDAEAGLGGEPCQELGHAAQARINGRGARGGHDLGVVGQHRFVVVALPALLGRLDDFVRHCLLG